MHHNLFCCNILLLVVCSAVQECELMPKTWTAFFSGLSLVKKLCNNHTVQPNKLSCKNKKQNIIYNFDS